MGNATRIYQAVTSRPWAMTEDSLRLMVEIAARKEIDIAGVEERLGRKLENTRTVSERGGVAIIPITGAIFRYANLFSEISGGTSVQVLARDFAAARDSSDVRAILFQIDSPGGDANGINELANMIYAARGKKPMCAYIGGMGCSAAYWLASAADEVVCDDTALVGSIGVVASVPAGDDPEEVVFISSQSPRKRPDPGTEEGRADIQAMLDAMADIFVAAVARQRGVSVETVLADFGQGGVFVGQQAVTAGLVDRLGSFESTLAGLARGRSTTAPATPEQARAFHQTVAQLASAQPSPSTAGPRLSASDRRTVAQAARAPQVHSLATKEHPMPPEQKEERVTAPLDSPATEFALSEAEREQIRITERARLQAEIEAIRTEARLEMQREVARYQREQKLTAWAQDATSPRMDRPKALPVEPQTLTSFVLALDALSTDLTAQFQGSIGRILTNDLIDFSEAGSEGGAETQDVAAQWQAAIAAKRASGLNASAAIDAVRREQPDLYRAYNDSGATVVRKPTPKGGR